MRRARIRYGARPRLRSTHGRYPSVPHSAAVSILAHIVNEPAHVVAALCQMATLAHVAGRVKKRNDSVDVAAELLARCEKRPRRDLWGLRA
jgi:hypothetical protein